MRKIVLLTLVVIISFASTFIPIHTTIAEASTTLTDVDSAEITRLEQEGIVTGFTDQTFSPQRQVTRAEAATMIGRALQLNGEKRKTTFPDVPATHYASGYIQSAVEANIITGYQDGTFGLDKQMTRAEMAVMLTRAFDLDEKSVVVFVDVLPIMYAFEAINKLATAKITTGYPGGTFRPDNNITRLEYGLLLARTLYPEYKGQVTAASMQPTFEVTVTSSNGLSVYPDPSTAHSRIGTLANSAETAIYQIIGRWAYVGSEEIIGFVPLAHLKAKATSNALSRKKIVVDPGHGGSDPGAQGNGIREKDIVLDVSHLLRLQLQKAGADVVMTRDTDIFITLDQRVAKAHEVHADSFISIHANSFTNPATHGTETFWNATYQSKESKELAEKIQKHLLQSLQTNDRGAKQANFRVITTTTIPSALVELGFLSNPTEAAKMKTDKFKQDAAEAILKGVIEFYSN